ncbi:MAG: AbrB/MazE/SpoVT family DNA-binding domain-containing protein [Armatimonadota bacterium]
MTLVMISEKGQITIPSKLRRKYNLRHGSYVDVDEKDNAIRVLPMKSVEEVAGIFEEAAKGKSTDYEEIQKQAMAKMAKEFVEDELS